MLLYKEASFKTNYTNLDFSDIIVTERIIISHYANGQSIFNNTVINRFMASQDEDFVFESPVHEAPEMSNNDVRFLSVLCSGVQGDHNVVWKTDNELIGLPDGTVNFDNQSNTQQLLSNYSSR